MFQLLSSVWLFALAGLLMPVLIHLWHKKKPRLIRVGSIRWLQAAASKRLSRLRFQDKWLLTLRCLILGLLAIFLCRPFWQQVGRVPPVKQLFVAPELLAPGQLKNIQNNLDFFSHQGYELRTFTTGFNRISPEKWQAIKAGEMKIITPARPENYWSLAKLISTRFKNTAKTIIISTNQAANFKGPRPVLPATYRWLTLPASGRHTWLQEAIQTGSDSIVLIAGSSSATGLQFKQVTTALPAAGTIINIPGFPALRYQAAGEKEFLIGEGQVKKTNIQKTPLRVSIFYDDSRKADAQYVQAALQAIGGYTGRPLNVYLTTHIPAITPESNWVFWLSDAAIPKDFVKKIKADALILKDTPSLAKRTYANWFRSSSLPEKITVYRHQYASNQNYASPIWTNNFGEALLHREQMGQGNTYLFRSRFNPTWNDLPNSPLFPELISALLFPDQPVPIQHDRRAISPEQAAPIFESLGNQVLTGQLAQRPLQNWFLALAALLFLAERIWSYRNDTP